jgi:hypothetical protein
MDPIRQGHSSSESARPPRLRSFRPIFAGICQRPVLLLTVGVVLAIAWGRLGSYLGVPDLFWHQDWWTQLLAGLGAALLFGQVCLVSFLIDADQPWLRASAPPTGPSPWWRPRTWADRITNLVLPESTVEQAGLDWRKLRWYLGVTWLPLLLLLALPALVYPTDDWPWTGDERDYAPNHQFVGSFYVSAGGSWVLGLTDNWCLVFGVRQRWPLLAGIALAFVVVRLFVAGFHVLYAKAWSRWHHTISEIVPALPRSIWFHLAGVLLFVGLLSYFWNASTPALVLLLALWVALHGAIVMFYRMARVPAEERWMHWLAGAAFALFFAVYLALFLFYWLTPDSRITALISPALAMWLLLALAVSCHGFLRFHFRGWYTLVLVAILGAGTLVNSLVWYQHQFPEMEMLYDKGKRVSLANSDFLAILSDSEYGDQQKLDLLLEPYQRFYQRYLDQARAQTAGAPSLVYSDEPTDIRELIERARAIRLALQKLELDRLDAWRAQAQRQSKQRPKLVVVAVSGGANRSALWTTFVLNTLERDPELAPFPQHVRIISGASGGMVGAAYFTATLPDARGHDPERDDDAFVSRVAQDHLTPVAQRLLFVDLPATFLPRPATTDRGLALEESWDRHMDGALRASFRALAPGEAKGWRPSLIFAPILVEDGRRLLISNLYLSDLTEGSGRSLSIEDQPSEPKKPAVAVALSDGASGKLPTKRMRPLAKPGKDTQPGEDPEHYRYSLSAVEFFQLFPDRHDAFRLSTAVRMSASFPYVSPAVDLPTEPRRRVVDAGYYDNYGVNVAASWIYHYRDWIRNNTSGVVLIQIRDSASERRRLYSHAEKDTWNLAKGLEWLTGPLVGANNALQSIMSFRNDEQLETLNDLFNKGTSDFFTTAVFESKVEIALSWHLTREDVRHILSGFDSYPDPQRPGTTVPSENQISLRRLKDWWKR